MITTALTTRCGIKYPIMQGGMQWVGTCDLAAAVSAAGGLGMLTALSHSSPEHLRAEIRRLRTLTDRPFGVNLTILPAIAPPDYMAFARVMVEEGVRIVETAGNKPAEYVRLFKDAQMVVIHKCTSVRHAVSAQRMGVDFVSIDGFECAGHPGEDDVGGVVLLVRAAQELSIPFVASGGFADGRGLAGALALGACGVNMGTRFMCSAEAPVHPRIKQCIVAASESDTVPEADPGSHVPHNAQHSTCLQKHSGGPGCRCRKEGRVFCRHQASGGGRARTAGLHHWGP